MYDWTTFRESHFCEHFLFPKVWKLIIRDILRFLRHFRSFSDAHKAPPMIFDLFPEIILFWNCLNEWCFFLQFLFVSDASLYEPSRQWPCWQFTGGPETFRLRLSFVPRRHPEVFWNVSIDVIWSLYTIEKVYRLILSQSDFRGKFDSFFSKCLKSILNHILRLFQYLKSIFNVFAIVFGCFNITLMDFRHFRKWCFFSFWDFM